MVFLSTLLAAGAAGANPDGGGSGVPDAGAPDGAPLDGRVPKTDTMDSAASDAAPIGATTTTADAGATSTPPDAGAPDTGPRRIEELTVVGTRESRTAGSAHVLRPRDLERMDYDNPEAVAKTVTGVYARGEDGFGLRPNIGIRGTSPNRSSKLTLMEDGVLFGPAPYSAPAAYYFPLMTRMELVKVIKGPGAVSYGPQTIGGAIDLVTRGIPSDTAGAVDLAMGEFGFGKVHGHYGASNGRSGFLIEGVHLRSTGFKQLDGGGDTGFDKTEVMLKGRHVLSNDPAAAQSLSLKLGYAEEDSRESYLGLTDADFRANPRRRYLASRFDRMNWHRTQAVASYRARFGDAFTLEAAVYRHDFHRTWRKVNRMGGAASLATLLANADLSEPNRELYGVLTGAIDSGTSAANSAFTTIYIGPNRREFVSQGAQVTGTWQGSSGPVGHRVEAGVRYHYDRIDRLHTEEGYLMRSRVLVRDGEPAITTADERAWANALALHVTDAATWGPITATPGVRVEMIRTHVRDRLNGTELVGAPQNVVIPGFGLYGAITPSLGVLAGVYRGFSPAAPGEPSVVKPEIAVNYEAGLRLSRPRLRLETIGFFNDYDNLTSYCMSATGCEESQAGMQYNAGRAHIYGTEVFARAEPIVAPGFTIPVVGAYTYTRTKLLETFDTLDPTLGPTANAGDELPFVPRHQGSVTVAFETPRGSIAVAGSYVSAMREHAGQGPSPGQPRTDPSLIFDVTARVNVTRRGHVYLHVRNLFDEADIAARLPYGARPVAPRWIQVGTKWSF
jgi:Fe(3+) dicitrate transport protein